MTTSTPILRIRAGVDWGSSSFRAYRFDAAGAVMDSVQSGDGIKAVTDGQFEALLFRHIEHWLEPGDSVLLSGMITSRNGWLETPYIHCPARPASDPEKLVKVAARDINLLFMPGLCQGEPGYDVMRGEELQLLGANAHSSSDDAVIVLPGTHSKWAITQGASILAFNTIATGELFDCLVHHSLVGAFAEPGTWNDAAFIRGVNAGFQTSRIVSQLFTARAAVLLEELAVHEAYAYLSGLLIGNEIKEGSAFAADTSSAFASRKSVTLVGSELLCKHYRLAMKTLGLQVDATLTDAAATGYARIASGINLQNQQQDSAHP